IEAVRRGAWNFLLKPIQDMSVLIHAIDQALERSRLIAENRAYQEHLEEEVTRRTDALQQALQDLNTSHVKLRESEGKYRSIFENLQDVYLEVCLNGKIREVSPSISNITTYTREEVLALEVPSIFPNRRDRKKMLSRLRAEGRITDYELYLRNKTGALIPCSLNACYQQPPDLSGDIVICTTIRDITERKQAEERIEYLAYYDALTGLPNRRLLLDRLEHAISHAQLHNHYGAMIFLDLDRFKNINDSLGHPVGDALLRQLALRLGTNLPAEDSVSRLGGDEFAVLLTDLGQDREQAAVTAKVKAEEIKQSLAEKFEIGDHELHVTPSIGVAMFPSEEEPETGNDILRYADTAMYRAKDDGRDTIRFFLPSMQTAADTRLGIEKELRQALELDQLELYFQPQVNLHGEVVGAESLLRWPHPEKGFISPVNFIPIAEASGLIFPLGEWVLRKACEHLKLWEQQGLNLPHLAINISPRQFHQASFVSQVRKILEETEVNANKIELELTEGIIIDNTQESIMKMSALNKLGLQLSIDDFGTGYSSLAYLKKMPLSILKIDQSFVRDIETNANDAAIVDTIIFMASHLNLKVIAEGVETETELSILKEKGCQFFQGNYFGKAIPEEEFLQRLRCGNTVPA
ncbi:MAG: diguanylate cyclase, partial [Desulfuromonas sp.]